MNNKMLKRAIAATAGVGLALTSLVGIAAPAQAAGPVVTKFKIHLNVPKSVAEQWNLWYWSAGAGVEPNDNTIGTSTRTVGGVPITQDWTPNFSNEDAWGVYAEFTLPGKLTALNNVMRTTESWNGQLADVATNKPAIAEADKPFGGDNIFPAGESWWNVNTGSREYPLKGFKAGKRTIKVHVNAPLATVQNAGISLWTWNQGKDIKQVLKNVKVGKTFPYAGKVPDNGEGTPFTASDAYGAVALLVVPKEVGPYSSTGFILRRSTPANLWAQQGPDLIIPNDATDVYINVGKGTGNDKYSVSYNSKPKFIGRWAATATYANGKITVTPVRPSAAALAGANPDTIVVTVKKGTGNDATNFANNKCTISTKVFGDIADFSWSIADYCDVTVAPGEEETTYSVFVQASASGIGSGLASAKENAKVVVPAAVPAP
jgi:hypothetical protein